MIFAIHQEIIEAAGDFEHAMVRVPDSALRDSDAVVMRVSIDLWQTLIQPSAELLNVLTGQASLILSRTKKTTVIVIPHSSHLADSTKGADHIVDIWPRKLFVPNSLNSTPIGVTKAEVAALRAQDLSDLLESARDRCVMCSSTNHHFQLPSGAHSSQFLRLAEAFKDLETVDRAAYWIALEVSNPLNADMNQPTRCLVVDNPSMLILGLRTEAILRQHLNLCCMPSYPADVETTKAVDGLLTTLSKNHDEIVVVISVASTGNLGSYIDTWASRRGYSGQRALALYSTRKLVGLEAMCNLDLPAYRHYLIDEACDLCKSGSEAIAIHGSTYLVGYKPATPTVMPPSWFDAQRPFLTKYGRIKGALRVHYDDPNELARKHHAFYIDVRSLLNDEKFVEELTEKFRSLSPIPNIIISPAHQTSIGIGDIASKAIGCPSFSVNTSISSEGDELKEALATAKCILVVDDIFRSGSRLNRFNRDLRDGHALLPNVTDVHFFTVLATPQSEPEYKNSIKGLISNHSNCDRKIHHLYTVFLPSWHGESDCPWCREQAILKDLLHMETDLDDPLATRLDELSNTTEGLAENCFSTAETSTILPFLADGSHALGGGASALELLFACASAVQQLRTDLRQPLDPKSFPAPRHLAVRVFKSNYSERLFWLALIRALKSSELETSLKEYLMVVAIEIDKETSKAYLGRELAIAALDGKFSILDSRLENFFDCTGIAWQRVVNAGFVLPTNVPKIATSSLNEGEASI